MAITNVPQISGPDFGGAIYGLNMNIGYSNAPSTLTIDIVNKNGEYSLPSLNTQTSVSFGSFGFNGTVWSYNLKESAAEKVLQVTLIDNSIALDRYYVLLWKRGLFGLMGSPQDITKTFIFDGESVLVPVKSLKSLEYPYTNFQERVLPSQSVTNTSYSLGVDSVGSVIVVGREKFANSVCDIPDTYYTFNDLKGAIPVNTSSAPSNNTWRSTHEGTLREVLSSWCSDLGFDFYWDFSSDTLVFYDVSKGISSLPNSTASNIISKETSASMEGTYRHYGVAYTAMPKEPIRTISATKNIVFLYSINPYPISYFINKIGTPQSINTDKGRWGGRRRKEEFIEAGFLGYVSRSLRDLYCFRNKHWEALGYKEGTGSLANKAKTINALKKFGFQDMIGDLESFDAEGLPNYDFNYISRDESISDKWHEIEQKLLTYHGKYYRHADTSGSFFYCTAKYTIEIDITVDPEAQEQELNSEDFAGRRVLVRGGSMDYDESSALEALGYEEIVSDIQNCAPIHIELKESGLLDSFLTAKLIDSESADKINTLVIFPNSEKFVTNKIGFRSSMTRRLNDLEKTWYDIKNANQSNGRKNCKAYQDTIDRNSCTTAEEIARNRAMKQVGASSDTNSSDPDDYVSGLVTKTAHSCTIKLKTGSVSICAPSDGRFQVVCKYNITMNKIADIQNQQFIWSAGSPGTAGDVAEIRVSNDNITDPYEDTYQEKRKSVLIRSADSSCTTPSQHIKYVFAGDPQGVSLSPGDGLSSLDVSLSSDGFKTSVTFRTKPPKLSKANNTVRYVQSQFNRASFNSS